MTRGSATVANYKLGLPYLDAPTDNAGVVRSR
jgi:hypothetical protein